MNKGDLVSHISESAGLTKAQATDALNAAIEGINGVLLLGWSTAFFVTVIARLPK